MASTYLQIFSMTDHAKALQGRYQGAYQGLNSDLQTSEFADGRVRISTRTRSREGDLDRARVETAKILLAYRHSDTGELKGTSEMLVPVATLPWTEMPGLEILATTQQGGVRMKLWTQEFELEPGKIVRIHFGKTIVLLKCYSNVDQIDWVETPINAGPSQLHAEPVTEELTIAAGTGSALVVKMGQETEQ